MAQLKRISVIGLGKLGLPLVGCLSRNGFRVIGVDLDLSKVRALERGICQIYEPGLQDLLRTSKSFYRATDNYEDAIVNSDVTFILVPTPSLKNGYFSLRFVLDAGRRIGLAMRKKQDYHLVVLTSTVMPGSTENNLKPLLEHYSGKSCGKDFGLCYNPEFVALGNVINGLLNPDFVLIGESDPCAGEVLSDLYRDICKNHPPIKRMSFANAELTKLAVNTFVTTKISFANMLARICENSTEMDVDIVTSALGLDSRIGVKYLHGAMGYGGPCFPRDNIALTALARNLGIPDISVKAIDVFNRKQVNFLKNIIDNYASAKSRIGVLGLAYKPNSDVVEESQGILLVQKIRYRKAEIIVYDPAAIENAKKILGNSVKYASSLRECIEGSDIVVIVTPWEEFKDIFQVPHNRKLVVIDCWRMLNKEKARSNFVYVPLGISLR